MMQGSIAAAGEASPRVLRRLSALLVERTGQQIATYRSWRVDVALKPLMREHNIPSLDHLVAQVGDSHHGAMADRVIDALLNQETSFFRDTAIFEMAVEAAAAIAGRGQSVRIWCAGCSTGQEPLSLAMLFAERAAETGAPMPEIVASDVSEAALARARAGRYTQFEIQRGLPIRRMMQWFDSVDGDWVAKPDLMRLITYRRHNLVHDASSGMGYDMVFCRNVLLYFSGETKRAVFEGLARTTKPGGLLALGAGETVIGQTRHFEPSRDYRGFYHRVG